jgi:hypothetical protein
VRIAIAAVFVIACDAELEAEPAATPAVRVEVAEPEAKPVPQAVAPAEPKTNILGEPLTDVAPVEPPIDAGPAAPGTTTTTQQREQAVLDLLAGAAPASRFVADDVDPDKTFDKDLRDRVAPPETVGAFPRARQKQATVGAGLDRDLVRRVVRSHINEVMHCYNLGLVRHAGLRGEVVLEFAIGPDGAVKSSALRSTSLRGTHGKNVGACMVKSVLRWKFPKPAGGATVDVVYPFELTVD